MYMWLTTFVIFVLRCSILNHNYLYHSSEEQFGDVIQFFKILETLETFIENLFVFYLVSLPEKKPFNIHVKNKKSTRRLE